MRRPRRLTPDEAAIWSRVAATVEPLKGRKRPASAEDKTAPPPSPVSSQKARAPAQAKPRPALAAPLPKPPAPQPRPLDRQGLDSGWERKLSRGLVHPDFTLDLHGHSLDSAHARLLSGLSQAKAMDARVVLVVTGRARPVEAADRGHRRGAIRAKFIDWLAHSDHALDIAAIRQAHRRHGGDGALYVVLKRRR